MKLLTFLGSSLNDIREFPDEARHLAGYELYRVQCGLDPHNWKPLPTVGPGVREIRIHLLGAWRVLYVSTIADRIYVLHAFQKKTQKTPFRDIELARQRYKQITG